MHSVTLIPRHLTEKLASTLRTTRVINIVGPRQTGKTTLVRDMVEAARFLDLDDESLLGSLALDPYGQLGTLMAETQDRKSTRLNSSHLGISYAVFCLKKKI